MKNHTAENRNENVYKNSYVNVDEPCDISHCGYREAENIDDIHTEMRCHLYASYRLESEQMIERVVISRMVTAVS